MRSTSHSSLATVLLLVPILAIPMLAIFGIPQFVPAVAKFQSATDSAANGTEPGGDAPAFSPTQDWTDEFSPEGGHVAATNGRWNDSPQQNADWGRPASNFDAPQTSLGEAATARGIRTAELPNSPGTQMRDTPATVAGSSATVVPTVYYETSAPLTWKSAVQRLNQLEIRNFRLEPGQQAGQFLFVCSYTPQHNPRLSYRFEAEADEPLKAVEKVLSQIDQWMASR